MNSKSGPHVLVTSQYFEPGYRAGGPIRSVARIIDTAPAGADITLLTSDRDLGDTTPYPGLSGTWTQRGTARVFHLDAGSKTQRAMITKRLGRTRFDLLYVNSLFNPRFSLAPIVAARFGKLHAKQILIAPRGEFGAGALSLKAGKKRYFLAVWLRFLRGMNVTWHATSEMEAADIRAAVPGACIEVCSDQGDLPETPTAGDEPGPTPKLVFLSRISRMKNLDLALKALAGVTTPVVFDIYGPAEDRTYWQECQALIAALPEYVTVQYHGEVAHDKVRKTFAGYDAFVLPTKGENFGHVIAEALSASCPVICSDRTPWTPVLKSGGGHVVASLTPDDVRAAIGKVVTGSPAERRQAKVAASAAYRAWRATAGGQNVIAQVLRLP